jgi:hypothetical protein
MSILGDRFGTFTTKGGKVVRTEDLPPEIQKELKPLGAQRDLADAAGNEPHRKKVQAEINELYNPDTRDAAMARRVGNKIVQELNDRLSARDARRR